MSNNKIVILGASAAGTKALETIVDKSYKTSVTLISKENVYGYYRPMLSKMLCKEIDYNSIFIKKYDWFKDNNVDVKLDTLITKIDTDNKCLLTSKDEKIEYDKLIIATGAESFMPPMEGSNKEGVFTLRYLNDSINISNYAKKSKSAVIIGGGVLGLEAACELKKAGLEVTVLESADRSLKKQLDAKSSELFEKALLKNGIILKKESRASQIYGNDKAEGVVLASGEKIPADLILVSAGVRPNVKLAEEAKIAINRAIVVDDKMQTNVADVYACGDCCEYDGKNFSLWSEASMQGNVAGLNAIGEESIYSFPFPPLILNIFDISINASGDSSHGNEDGYSMDEKVDTSANVVEKIFYKAGEQIGKIVLKGVL